MYDALPGEIAPKLALGVAAEYVGDWFAAARFYELVWRTDHAYVSAAFGLARVYLQQGARASAIEVLETVPESSSHHVAAQVAAIKIKTTATKAKAARSTVTSRTCTTRRPGWSGSRWTPSAAPGCRPGCSSRRTSGSGQGKPTPGARVLGCGWTSASCGSAWSAATARWPGWRARSSERQDLVDKANAIRPRTLT